MAQTPKPREKRCPKCRTSRPTSEFYANRSEPDGLSHWCSECSRVYQRKYRNTKQGQKTGRSYDSSVAGVARSLRYDHGYSKEDSIYFAKKLLTDYSRCEICGIPSWFVKLTHRKGGPFITGNSRNNRRLVVDHIIPGKLSTRENTRILCHGCNTIRGAAIYTDVEVLRRVRRWWRNLYAPRFLFWLNTQPGEGGRLFRSEYMERKEMKLIGQQGLEHLASLGIKIGDSHSGSAAPSVSPEGGTS